MKREVSSPEEMKRVAAEIFTKEVGLPSVEEVRLPFGSLTSRNQGALIFALSGELGAGKTTFAQGVAEALGVIGPVVSPTFTIMRIYKTKEVELPSGSSTSGIGRLPFTHLVHIDAYRLETADELARLGWDELARDAGNCIVLEWPEHVASLLLEHAVRITLTLLTDTVHEISYQD